MTWKIRFLSSYNCLCAKQRCTINHQCDQQPEVKSFPDLNLNQANELSNNSVGQFSYNWIRTVYFITWPMYDILDISYGVREVVSRFSTRIKSSASWTILGNHSHMRPVSSSSHINYTAQYEPNCNHFLRRDTARVLRRETTRKLKSQVQCCEISRNMLNVPRLRDTTLNFWGRNRNRPQELERFLMSSTFAAASLMISLTISMVPAPHCRDANSHSRNLKQKEASERQWYPSGGPQYGAMSLVVSGGMAAVHGSCMVVPCDEENQVATDGPPPGWENRRKWRCHPGSPGQLGAVSVSAQWKMENEPPIENREPSYDTRIKLTIE